MKHLLGKCHILK